MVQKNNKISQLVGRRIFELRKTRGLNQHRLAVELGVSSSSISKIETGVTDTNLSRLDQLAKLLDVDLIEFFLQEDDDQNADSINIGVLEMQLELRDESLRMLQRQAILLYELLLPI